MDAPVRARYREPQKWGQCTALTRSPSARLLGRKDVQSSRSLERRSMPKEHALSASTSGHQIEISNLVRAHGITRDQARRLIRRFGNNRAKLSEAARTLKTRSAAPRKAALELKSDRSESRRS